MLPETSSTIIKLTAIIAIIIFNTSDLMENHFTLSLSSNKIINIHNPPITYNKIINMFICKSPPAFVVPTNVHIKIKSYIAILYTIHYSAISIFSIEISPVQYL